MITGHSETALILAPTGRDSTIAQAMLTEAGIRGEIVDTVAHLAERLDRGAAFAVIADEALGRADLNPLASWITAQPEWSDFPFVLLTRSGGGLERNPVAARYLEMLGNVTFIERPFHPTTLVSLSKAALRARKRQYEARARLEDIRAGEARLREQAAELERKFAERSAEIEATRAQLHEAQKLETIGQLTGGVAHDFNNLLTPIFGALDLIKRRLGDGGDARTLRLIDTAQQSADRAKTLVQRLLGFARRQTLKTVSVDLGHLLHDMRELIASSVGSIIEVRVTIEEGLPPCRADANQLELAILNLCVNARDAMPDGGVLMMAAGRLPPAGAVAAKLVPGDYVRLAISDTGTGMDAATLKRAVEPFFSTKETGRGTGLGLSMVHGLAAQLGGGFALSSIVGEGTRADLYLPVAHGEAVEPRSQRAPVRDAPAALSLLVVDDEALVRAGTAEMLRDLGHQVAEAASGAVALARLREDAVDAVVTDYRMPRMDGAELVRKIREQWPELPVLLITGYTGTTEHLPGLSRLAKPFGQAEIGDALAKLMARQAA